MYYDRPARARDVDDTTVERKSFKIPTETLCKYSYEAAN